MGYEFLKICMGGCVNCYDFFEINGIYAEKFVQNQLYIDNQSLSPKF